MLGHDVGSITEGNILHVVAPAHSQSIASHALAVNDALCPYGSVYADVDEANVHSVVDDYLLAHSNGWLTY